MPRWIPLSVLVSEKFASSPSAMWTMALDRGLPVAFDGKGRVCVEASAVDKMRRARAEREAREKFERELAAAEQQQQREEAEVAAAVARERQQQLRDRERRLVERTGASLAEIEGQMRREAWLEPNVMFTLDDRDRLARHDYSLEDLERYVDEKFGPDVLDLAS